MQVADKIAKCAHNILGNKSAKKMCPQYHRNVSCIKCAACTIHLKVEIVTI